MSQNVFISYSRKNASQALELAARLKSRGMEVWIDQKGIEGASRWTSEITKGIEAASVVVLLISPDSMASENVLKEVDIALEWKKRIVPVDLEKVPLTRDFMYHLVGLQRVGFHDFDAVYRACLKPIESSIIRPPDSGAASGSISTSVGRSSGVSAYQALRKRFREWRWFTWVVLIYSLLGLVQVTESLIYQGENGLPNGDWEVLEHSLQLTKITPLGLAEGFRAGDTLIEFAGAPVGGGELTDAFFDAMKRHRAGDLVPVVVGRANGRVTIMDRLRNVPMPDEQWYGSLAMVLIVAFIVGLMLYRQPGNPQVALFDLIVIIAAMFEVAPFNIPLPRSGVGFPGILTLMGPTTMPEGAFLVHFASFYLRKEQRRWFVVPAYAITMPAAVSLSYNAIGCLFRTDLAGFVSLPSYVIEENTAIAILMIVTVVVFIIGYVQTKERGVRKRIRILIWSTSLACLTSLVLAFLPPLGIIPYVPHSGTIMLGVLCIMLIGMAIGIARTQVFDSDIVINKSLVYAAVLGVLLTAYYGVNELTGSPIVAALMLAVLFEPSKRFVQTFIDRRFFKVTFNFRAAEREAASMLTNTGTVLEIGEYIVGALRTVLPTETAAFYTIESSGGITFISSTNANEPDRYRAMGEEVHRRLMEFGPEAWDRPVGLPDILEPQVKAYAVEDDELRTLGAALLTPVRSAEGGLKGFFLSGKKTNGWKYSAEDIDLLQSISVLTSHALARIERNAEAQLQEAEQARLDRRKRMKSISGSSLPHEVWVMGDNIQIFRAIERKQLAFGAQEVDLDALVQSVIQSLGPDLLMEQFEVDIKLDANASVQADPKLLEQAIRTLISHAMKYSSTARAIDVTSERVDGILRLTVTDHGVGMTPEELAIVFDPFRRGANKGGRTTGAGLGMYVVKHVVEASGGTVELRSTPGKGTAVSLTLPVQPTVSQSHNM